MTPLAPRLAPLVPGVYGSRDDVVGAPLARLLEVLQGEITELVAAIGHLSDSHFVERADADALVLIAALLDARLFGSDPRVNRGVVARTVAWRRRRGTLPTLEEVVSISTGWGAEVDEAYRSLAQTQDLRNLVPWRGRTAVLWDPITLADPLTRRPVQVVRPVVDAAPTVGRRPDETLDEALRRLGRADAGQHAASPRGVDFLGWARPDVALVRTTRLVDVPMEGVAPRTVHTLVTPDATVTLAGFRVDPLDRDAPIVWRQPLERPDLLPVLTSRHEPEPVAAAPDRTTAALLTPTALAADPDAAEAAGALEVAVDGIPVVGPPAVPEAPAALSFEPLGPEPVLRFADPLRPAPKDAWRLKLLASQEEDDFVLAAAQVTHGAVGAPTVTPEAAIPRQGATIRLRVRRLVGMARQRDASGTWSDLDVPPRLGTPVSPLVVLDDGGTPFAVRVERHVGGMHLARLIVSGATATWEQIAIDGDALPDADGMAAAADGTDLLVVAIDAVTDGMDVWRIPLTASATTATATRLGPAEPDAVRPHARLDPAATLHDGSLWVFGGAQGGAPIGELWSLSLGTTPAWAPHMVRNPKVRRGGQLLPVSAGLLLIGGQSEAGALDPTPWVCDPAETRPRWRPLPALPVEVGRAGLVAARAEAGDLAVVAWADDTRPTAYALADGAAAWTAGARETDATNPPAPGEALWWGDALVVAGPTPLPPSEAIFSMGGRSFLVFLPSLDLRPEAGDASEAIDADEAALSVPADAFATFEVSSDGSTFLALAPGEAVAASTRPGGALHTSLLSRAVDVRRIGVPERLERHFFSLRQRNLGRWDDPIHLQMDGIVGLDPRLGRVLLPVEVPVGQVTVSWRQGRPAPIGAGAMPPDRAPLPSWEEPDETAPLFPDRRPATPDMATPGVEAWVAPLRAGTSVPPDGGVPVFATLGAAASYGGSEAVVGILGSASLPAERVSVSPEGGLCVVPGDVRSVPLLRADPDEGGSLAVHSDLGGSRRTDVWLAGLWLEGRLDLHLVEGEADLRWCTLGAPGVVSVRIPGAGHQDRVALRSIPETEVELRLYGCQVGVLQVPPWVRVTAAGCTFDAGSREGVAIDARGSVVRLRHCTVHGTVEAGDLRATACAFAGALQVGRPDLGWIRHSLVPDGGRPSRLHRSLRHGVGFVSIQPTNPLYLVLADANGEAALRVAELGREPGAYSERSDRLRELTVRADEHVPIGMIPFHADRATLDITRMNRPPRRPL